MTAFRDDDYGLLEPYIEDEETGDIAIMRTSATSGYSTVMQLGTVAVSVAKEILRLSGEASVVQSVADTLTALAEEGCGLSAEDTLAIAMTLRHGVQVPKLTPRKTMPTTGVDNVIQFRGRVA